MATVGGDFFNAADLALSAERRLGTGMVDLFGGERHSGVPGVGRARFRAPRMPKVTPRLPRRRQRLNLTQPPPRLPPHPPPKKGPRRRPAAICCNGPFTRPGRSGACCFSCRSTSGRWSSGCSWSSASARRCRRRLVDRLEAAIRDKKFQDAYDACKDNDSFLARLVRTGIANLPNGRPEAKEAMETADRRDRDHPWK